MRQVFSVLGSSKVLGSPLGLLSNLQAGVKVSEEGGMHAAETAHMKTLLITIVEHIS